MHRASFSGNLAATRYLLSRGLDVNALTENDVTPLMLACYNEDFEVIQLLVENNAEIERKTETGYVFMFCIWDSRGKIVTEKISFRKP